MHAGLLREEYTHTHSVYVILIAFPLQQWLHERVSLLRHTYTACHFLLSCINTGRCKAASSLTQRSELIHTNILNTSKRHKYQLKFRLY